jgi:precorrin-8X/cobalt-precorrin-8 methylmutase
MLDGFTNVRPEEIEKKSFEIISEEIGECNFPEFHEAIVKRVIHTTADFDYAKTLEISDGAVKSAMSAIRNGCGIITDTMMAYSGINKKSLADLCCVVDCFIQNDDIADKARESGVTRASLCMEKAAADTRNKIFVVGNAPTALIRLGELIQNNVIKPALVVGVPVGFVNVVESKEFIKSTGVPYIVSNGRKGGSNVAAAIINAIVYQVKV